MLAHTTPTWTTRFATAFAVLALVALLLVLPHGKMAPVGEMRGGEFVHDEGRMMARGFANAAGGLAVLLTVASLALPYLKRPRLTRLHGRIGFAVLALAGIHTTMFLAEGSLRGWAPGFVSLFAFAFHGLTGALKAHFARVWGPAWWRFAHRGSAWVALVMVAEHVVIASWHFGLARWFEEGRW